jgi:multidrug efflux pump subunit AcrB
MLKMARLNVDFATVNRYLRSAFTGIDVTDIRYGDTDVDFRMYLGSPHQSDAVISTLKISNRNARPVPLKQFSSCCFLSPEGTKSILNFATWSNSRPMVLVSESKSSPTILVINFSTF